LGSHYSKTNKSNKLFLPFISATHLKVIIIATNQAIADTGGTSIFIMDGVDVENKCIATQPLTINLHDGKKVISTHVCDIRIPGLPILF
jgi:hypothetical protein